MMLVSVGHSAGRRPQEMVQLAVQAGALRSCVPLLCASAVDSTDSGLSSQGVRTLSIN